MNPFAQQPGPRERVLDVGIEGLGDAELIALVLGTGRAGESVHVLSSALLEEAGGLGGLARMGLGALAARGGVGHAKGSRLAAALELGRRIAAETARGASFRLTESRAVDAWARPRLVGLDHEELWLLALDGRHGLRAARRVASGSLHGLHVLTHDPLRIALREGASAFVLIHNHPSGDPTPSREDLHFTERMFAASQLLGIPLLDHVIVAATGYVSLLDTGSLPEAKAARSPKSSVPPPAKEGVL